MHLPDWLARRAALHPERPALICAGQTWSFASLHRDADLVALCLRELGVQPGDRVALLARNSPGYAAILHATPRCGMVLVPLNTRLSEQELAWQLADCRPRLLIYDEAYAAQVASLPVRSVALENLGMARSPTFDSPTSPTSSSDQQIDLAAPHTLIYTSGTTGQPKGALLTAGNHWWSATASMLNLGLNEADRWLAVLPLFHVGGLSILMRGAIYGMPVVLHERFEPTAVLQALVEERVTLVSLVAVMLQRLLDHDQAGVLPASLRCVLLGGGPAPRPLLEACAARDLPVAQTYGMTETASQVATLAPADALRKLGSAGQPLLPMELRVEAPTGEVGEICVRGPMVTPGYYNRPEATAKALRDGWLHTGDLGYLDEEGYLYIVDRRSDLIISGGENIYPAEVEAALLAHPAVAEAGVVGMPDATWGEVPVAFVVAREGSTPEVNALLEHCRASLAGYKIPRRITLVNELPRTAAGKLRRNLLRTML
ncbi:o-succinylbenzoate--CoA ligase [Candidatus Chloroploca asiatica]|uniref:2-succinylbenzoate--CoA ligase n=1 Tax=Candidatus Chloroploca asiatica TaxID=1506545 RepID=A0A2H3L4S8_9CHLR|nr:o-succinylbenzoate--CoA ligase [Candidatus Chloroploca asiatica]PDV98176.1 O-succinylbenzoate-CoA ligase [Candidatus Chloroploca asiatica]